MDELLALQAELAAVQKAPSTQKLSGARQKPTRARAHSPAYQHFARVLLCLALRAEPNMIELVQKLAELAQDQTSAGGGCT